MQKLICLKRDLDEPPPRYLIDAVNPLKPFWPQCQKTPHWADLNKAFNRIVGGVFFEADAPRAAELLERLAQAAEAGLQSSRITREEVARVHEQIQAARDAANTLRFQLPLAILDATVVDDVDCERFHRREARV